MSKYEPLLVTLQFDKPYLYDSLHFSVHGAYVPLVIFIGAVVILQSACYYIKFIIKKSTFIYIQMILSRKKLYKIKKTKEQSRRRRKHRNKKI